MGIDKVPLIVYNMDNYTIGLCYGKESRGLSS